MTIKDYWKDKKLRNTVLIVVAILAIAVFLVFSKKYNPLDYLKKEERKKQAEIERLVRQRDSLEKVHIFQMDSIKNIKSEIDSYYDDYIQKAKEIDRLQRTIANLRNSVYGKHSLDSIAEHVKY